MIVTSLQVPLADLKITKTNARKDHTVDRALVASIASVGLLYPLVVDAIEGGQWDVVDGAQRLLAIREGLKLGVLTEAEWQNIACIPRSNGAATGEPLEISLHANLRTPMHPLDECEAILKLAKNGDDKEAIALRFGQDLKWLEQRVKLAQLAPEVKEVFRSGQIGLSTAMIFTLGSSDQQKAFLKRHKKLDVNQGQIHAAMVESKISAKAANFDLALYPEKSIQRDLFAPAEDPLAGIWLLDRKKFAELQDAWATEEIEKYKQLGYDRVEVLASNDWQTLQNHVEFDGKVRTAEQRGKLSVFLKADHNGHIDIHQNMISRKALEKAVIKKARNGAASDSTEAEPKPMKCTELTPAQHEIMNGLAAAALFNEIASGSAHESLLQWLVVARQFYGGGWVGYNAQAFEHNGSRARWGKLAEEYPTEAMVETDEAHDKALRTILTYEEFSTLSAANRRKLFNHAVASMIVAPYGNGSFKLGGRKELKGLDWLVPNEDFFKRFRTDQLIDYRKRSGDREAGATAKKKGDHVADCVVAAMTKGAFQFGTDK